MLEFGTRTPKHGKRVCVPGRHVSLPVMGHHVSNLEVLPPLNELGKNSCWFLQVKMKQQTTGCDSAVTHVNVKHLYQYVGRGAGAGNNANLPTWLQT